MRLMVRLREVADLAGVSTKTVSQVVNGRGQVSSETRRRVEDAVRQLGYRPNLSARHLAGGRTGIILLLLPSTEASYFGQLAQRIISGASADGLSVVTRHSEGDLDREVRELKEASTSSIDGVIALLRHPLDAEFVSPSLPLLLLGEMCGTVGPVDHVGIDNAGAGAEVVRHLLSQGRRRIAVLGSALPGDRESPRVTGAQEALVQHGLAAVGVEHSAIVSRSKAQGYAAAQRLLAHELPDAMFCVNDDVALGALAAVRDHGLSVPGDVAIAGFDNTDQTQFSSPRLTTVAVDLEAMAAVAVARLLVAVGSRADQDRTGQAFLIPHQLIPRASTVRE
jgi:DNA-binding LacI/PurR family transcriptional regulator